MSSNCVCNTVRKVSGLTLGLIVALVVVAVGFSISTASAADVIINGLPYKLDQGGLRFGTDGSITVNMSNQAYSGKISGKVDVPGTEVFLKSPAIDTGVAKYTRVDRFGNFLFDNLPDGTFDVMPVLGGYSFTHPAAQADQHVISGGSVIANLLFYGVSNAGGTPTPAAPAAPSGLTCTPYSTTQINLGWTDNSNDETQFRVYMSTSNSKPGTTTGTTATNVASYSATGLTANTTYYYWVEAYNNYGASSSVSCSASTTAVGGNPPAAPSGLICTSASTSQINLSWTDNSTDETQFRIFRNTSNSKPASYSATAGTNVTTYSNTGLTAGTTYYYWLESYNTYGASSSVTCTTATQSATGGAGSGSTASDPKTITVGTALMGEVLNAGVSRYYKVTIDTTKQTLTFGMASRNQDINADCNMLISSTNGDIDTKYTTVTGLYNGASAWGVIYVTPATSPVTMANFSHATSGEGLTTQKPYSSSVFYIKIKNEGTKQEIYNLSVTQQ